MTAALEGLEPAERKALKGRDGLRAAASSKLAKNWAPRTRIGFVSQLSANHRQGGSRVRGRFERDVQERQEKCNNLFVPAELSLQSLDRKKVKISLTGGGFSAS